MSALTMRVLCGWCGVLIKAGDPDGPVSHGICPRCAAKFSKDAA